MGSRRFLPLGHSWRNNAKAFDDTKESPPPPTHLSGDDIVQQYQQFDQVSIITFFLKSLFQTTLILLLY